MNDSYRCGIVAVVGQANVGKSTLVNQLVGKKICITSRRQQTTRNRILGIKTDHQAQIIYIDTPGLHNSNAKLINRHMNRAARSSLVDADCVLMMITVNGWHAGDYPVLEIVKQSALPTLLVINKVDLAKDKAVLLPLIKQSANELNYQFTDIVPVSALTGDSMDTLQAAIIKQLPLQQQLFPEHKHTDQSDEFIAAEIIREQLIHALDQELPYATAVQINKFEKNKKLLSIDSIVWVERKGQKAIVIGKQGERLKRIGSAARVNLERYFDCKIYLNLWVKVRENWTDHNDSLMRLISDNR